LRARSFPLSSVTDQPVDLNEFARGDGFLFVRDGIGFAGHGISATTTAQNARMVLEDVFHETSDAPVGVGPLMFGSIPFNQDSPSEFILPAVTLAKTAHGETWVTVIDDAPLPPWHIGNPTPTHASFSVHEGVPVTTYLSAVDTARRAVQHGEITKAVIARDVFVESNMPIDIHAVLLRLRASFGSSYRFSFDGFIGASPELLVAIDGDEITSHPLAGTTPRTGDPVTDRLLADKLLASSKNQIEHRVVINMVHDTLLPHCSYLDWEAEPSIVQVANVAHLGTQMIGKLSEPRLHVLDAALALSPTPALGGFPRDKALALIARCEGLDRGRYGGAVGWFDQHGNGTFAVAIRCAQLNGDRTIARLFAGGGIVADSEPLDELAETQAKLQAMLAALIRP
jgi:isochorismate synthase